MCRESGRPNPSTSLQYASGAKPFISFLNFQTNKKSIIAILRDNYCCLNFAIFNEYVSVYVVLFVCVGVLRPSQERGHVEPVS